MEGYTVLKTAKNLIQLHVNFHAGQPISSNAERLKTDTVW